MSTFSSVVRKPGQKIVPKTAPRRNVQRKVAGTPAPVLQSQVHDSVLVDISHELSDPREHVAQVAVNARQEPSSVDHTRPDTESLPDSRTATSPRDHTPISSFTDNERLESNNVGHTPVVFETVHNSTDEQQSPHSRKRKAPLEEPQIQEPAIVENGAISAATVVPSVEPSSRNDEVQAIHDTPSTPRRRRKPIPRATPTLALSLSRSSASPSVPAQSNQHHSRRSSSQSHPPADLLQFATEQAASVSTLANNIDLQTRLQQRRGDNANNRYDNLELQASRTSQPSTNSKLNPTYPKRKRKTVQEQAAEVVTNVLGNGSSNARKRGMTPEDAENYQLDPEEMTMGKLCKDNKLGKKSALEAEMQANWPEILQRRKEDREKALIAAQSRRRKAFGKPSVLENLQATVAVGPQQMIVNGKIVVVNESREIDRNAQLEQAAVLDETNVREDRDYYKRVNQSTVGMKATHGRRFRWDDESTQRFYKGLRMFGTDFLMIANMFPGLDRKQIKMKFIREENEDKARIMDLLHNREEVDLAEYSEVTSIMLQDVEEVEAKIREEEQRLRNEDNERRKREGFVTNDADVPLGSQEGGEGTAEGLSTTETGADASANAGRYASVAADIMAPKKRQRKTNVTNKKRGPKAGRRPAEGIEEVLGPIDEVRV